MPAPRPLFGTLNATLAKRIAMNAPRYTRIVEPFGDYGTFALTLEKKKPRQHVVNIVDEELLLAMTWIQQAGSGELGQLRRMDWIGSQETFDSAMAVQPSDSVEGFWRFIYIKKFGMKMSADAESEFDILATGVDLRNKLNGLPLMKAGLRGVTLSADDPLSLVDSSAGTLLILLPKKPEEISAVEGRLSGIGGPFFYARKALDGMEIVEKIGQFGEANVGAISKASIMLDRMLTVWNFPGRPGPVELKPLEPDFAEVA